MKNHDAILYTNKFDRILWWVTLFKLRYNRGNSWMNEIKDVAQIMISLFAAKQLLNFDIDLWIIHFNISNLLTGKRILLFGVAQIFLGYFIGAADELKLLLWQRENIYNSRNVNPVFAKMEEEHSEMGKSIEELHEKIDGMELNKTAINLRR